MESCYTCGKHNVSSENIICSECLDEHPENFISHQDAMTLIPIKIKGIR